MSGTKIDNASATGRPLVRVTSRHLVRVERLRNSEMGNPAWRLHFADGTTLRTKANTGLAYEISPGWEGRVYDVTLSARGTVIDMTPQQVTCLTGCGQSFYLVPARGERAGYCLDCADIKFGRNQ